MEAQATQSSERAPFARRRLVATLGLLCMVAALLSGIVKGVWELTHPLLSSPDTFTSVPAGQRVIYGLLEVVKSAGFAAGLVGLYRVGTRRGPVVTAFLAAAIAGSVFFAAVWMVIGIRGRFTHYVLGGIWPQMVAPVALGVAAWRAGQVERWVALYAIIVGVANSQIFVRLSLGRALVVQGVLWMLLGYAVWRAASRA